MPDLSEFLEKNSKGEIPEYIDTTNFQGITIGGNSGGGLFTLEGNLIGISSTGEGAEFNSDFASVAGVFKALDLI